MTAEVSGFLDDFKWYMSGERRLSPNTTQGYRFDLEAWRAAGLDPESRTVPELMDVRAALQKFDELKLSPATLARRSASLRLFVKFRALRQPEWEKLLEEIPVARVSESLPKALTKTEIATLLDFDPQDAAQTRDRAILELMYASGLRVSEATELKISEIDERAGLLRIMGKGSKERLVPYTERAGEWLERYREQVRPIWIEKTPRKYADHLFLSRRHKPLTRMAVWKILHKRALLCGVDHVHPHILRHSFATHLLQGGADIRFVQALLGHASLGTTERYIRVADDELKRVFAEFHPLP